MNKKDLTRMIYDAISENDQLTIEGASFKHGELLVLHKDDEPPKTFKIKITEEKIRG